MKTKRLRLGAITAGVALALGGVAEAQSLRFRPQEVATVAYQRPELGAETIVEPGATIVVAGRANPAILVTQGGKAPLNGNKATVNPGLYRLVARSDAGAFYQPDEPITLSALGLGGTWPDGGLYVPDDRALPLRVYMRNPLGMLLHSKIDGVEFAPAPPAAVPGGFRRELVYGGVAKGVVSITYREFVNDMARPAFTQTLSYDLSDGDELAYRGARLKVLSANNTGLRFVVLAPLTPEP